MQPPQIFDNAALGSVRVVSDDTDTPYFVAADVCRALGYKNSRKAVADHVDAEDVTKRYTLSKGGKQQTLCVNESGVYALIFGSTLPRAREFKRWVTSEVLPAIRRGGMYAPAGALAALESRVLALETSRRLPVDAGEQVLTPGIEHQAACGRGGKGLYVCDYNGRSIVVVGDASRRYRRRLKALGGRYCPFLRRSDGGCMPGWVFPLRYKGYVLEQLSDVLADDPQDDAEADDDIAARRAARAEYIKSLGEDE